MIRQQFLVATITVGFAAVIGCGGADVVSVERSQTATSGSRSQTAGDSTERQSWPSTSGNPNAQSSTPNTEVPTNPTVVVTEAAPTETPVEPTEPAPPTSTETPTETPVVTPPPPPSDYRVLLPMGGSLDVKRLLDKHREEFEVKLAAIARGKQMLRTYYMDDSSTAGEAAPPVDVAPDPVGPAAIPQSFQADRARRPRRRPGNGGATSTRRPVGQNGAAKPKVDTTKPFMYIGRIAATLRGPTAAYYRDGTPMIYVFYNRDSRRDGTLISWDEKGRPVVLDQFVRGRRNGMRVLFRTRSDNDPTGYVALVQEWRAGEVTATHLVADHGGAQTIEPSESLLDETNEELNDRLAELNEFDKTLRENEQELRKALTAMHREEIRMAKAIKSALRQQQQALALQAQFQILQQLTSGIQSPGAWRNGYRNR